MKDTKMTARKKVWTVLAYYKSGNYAIETYDFETPARTYFDLLCKDFIDKGLPLQGAAILSPEGVLTNTHGKTPADTAKQVNG